MTKYFVVGSPTQQYYPWVMDKESGDPFLFDSVEEAKQAIIDYSWVAIDKDSFWIGEKIELDVDEINSKKETFEQWKKH